MTGYNLLNIADMVKELGEIKTKSILSDFSCPMNLDVEDFIKRKAIEFSKQFLTRTQLVVTSFKDQPVIAGYFAVCQKSILLKRNVLSSSLMKRVSKFGTFYNEQNCYIISAPLIAQLGKNYSNGYNSLISGDELLVIACQSIRKAQYVIGGKLVYLECEENQTLREFYSSNGFVEFGTRVLSKDEKGLLKSDRLVQLLKYLDD